MKHKHKFTLVAAALACCLIWFSAQAASTAANPADTLVISASQPLAASKKTLRHIVYERCKEMLEAPAGKFGAHPSAASFPGLVADNAPRITRAVTIKHVPPDEAMLRLITPLDYSSPFEPTMYSSGLYAAPGEVIMVEIPGALVGKLEVQIGCHTDDLSEDEAANQDWRRMPLLVSHTKLDGVRTQASNPFGGLIFITCPPTTPAWQGQIVISNAVMAPLYVLGRTTDAEWEHMLQTSGAPWGELCASNVILMLRTPVLKKIHDPARRAQLWDNVIGAEMDLAQLPLPFYRKQRLVTDVHISAGFMHSGYPIMVHHCPEKGMSTEDFISDPAQFMKPANGGPNWGFFHEIGHNMQNTDWVFDGTTEVSVNLFSMYCFDKITGGRDQAHEGISSEFTRKALRQYFSKAPDLKKWKSDPFLALVTFRLIQNDFGWDLFKRTFVRYHELPDVKRPKDDQQRRDDFVRYLSESAGRDFAPYFNAWGIPLSANLKDSLKQYPEWMPYDFPPSAKPSGQKST